MKNSGYGKYLSECYDVLNTEIDYSLWADFYEKCFEKYFGKRVNRICEMACGTGSMALELAKRGYSVTAFDLSENMLSFADKKAYDKGVDNIVFTLQDMRNFKVYSKTDAVICMLDSINCLTDVVSLEETFESVYNSLCDGGVFVFDVNTKTKFENVYSDNAYVLEDENVLLAWQNFYNKKTRKCDMYLTFFLEDDDGRYTRFDEHIVQKNHSERTLIKALLKTGFEVKEKVCDFDFTKSDEKNCDRLIFVCQKKNA